MEDNATNQNFLETLLQKEADFIKTFQDKADQLPDIPVVKSWIQSKLANQQALYLISTGTDPITNQKFDNFSDRFSAFLHKEAQELGQGVKSGSDALLLMSGGEGSEIGSALKGLGGEGGEKVLLDNAPKFFETVAKNTSNPTLQSFLTDYSQALATINKNPIARKSLENGIKDWSLWQSFTGKQLDTNQSTTLTSEAQEKLGMLTTGRFPNITTQSTGRLFITFKSQKTPPQNRVQQALANTKQLRENIAQAGALGITGQELFLLAKGQGIDLNINNLDGFVVDTAVNFWGKGGTGQNLHAAVDVAQIPLPAKEFLYKTAVITQLFEEAYPQESQELYYAADQPVITIQQAPQLSTPIQTNQLGIDQVGNYFRPVLNKGINKITAKVKEKVFGAVKKGGKKLAGKIGGKVLTEAGKKTAELAAKAGITAGAEAAGVAASAAGGPIALAITVGVEAFKKVLGVIKRGLNKILTFFTGEEDFRKQLMWIGLGAGAIFLGLGMVVPAAVFGLLGLGAGAAYLGGSAIASGAVGVGQAIIYGIAYVIIPSVAVPVVLSVFGLLLLIIIIIFIINAGAFVVPYGGFSLRSAPPPVGSGLVSLCTESEETGLDITDSLASRIQGGVVNLLPETVWGRADGICIAPTMIIVHWSAGTNDNPDGNQRTYDTLVSRNLSCQLATDTNDTWLMERFFELQVEFPACSGEWNTYSINNEMAGVYFTDTPPPPNLDELELAYDATCKVMEQYNIPWCQIYGHFEVPNSGGKPDPGEDFLYNVFIPEIRDRCPNDNENTCSGTTRP